MKIFKKGEKKQKTKNNTNKQNLKDNPRSRVSLLIDLFILFQIIHFF